MWAVIVYLSSDYRLRKTSVNRQKRETQKSISHPFLCCWKSAGLLMLLRYFLQDLEPILHKMIYKLAKIITRKKAWNRRFKPEKSSIYAAIAVAVPAWRPLLYQLSYTPKYLVEQIGVARQCGTCFRARISIPSNARKVKKFLQSVSLLPNDSTHLCVTCVG